MSYQVLARKYRPRSFDTLVGQEHVVRALTHALEKKRLHHAYLFTGTRGVGKTTLSRILAKSFNCQGADGNGDITAVPCGVCDACVSIDAGRFVDYIEMDAASNRGVDDMAQLLEQAVYAPSNARFKVYMIDEVHMLTNQAFNSMLKTLEEPPEHVKFILATTDPQKIPVTVLSRCLQFNLKQMPPGHIVGHLENILGQEEITFDVPALRLLAQGARGSMRDALSLTDQAIAYAAGRVTLEAVQGMLGALDQTFLIRLLDALALADGAALLAVADDMAARSLSYNAALQDLGTLLHRVALAQTVPAALPEDLPERADILRLAEAFDAEEVQLFYQIVVHGRNDLGLAPDEYAGFTMTLLRMLAFRPGVAPAPSGSGGQGAAALGRPAARAAVTGSAAATVSARPAAQDARAPMMPTSASNPVANAVRHDDASDGASGGGAPSAAPGVLPTAISALGAQNAVLDEGAPTVGASMPRQPAAALSPAMAALAAARGGRTSPSSSSSSPVRAGASAANGTPAAPAASQAPAQPLPMATPAATVSAALPASPTPASTPAGQTSAGTSPASISRPGNGASQTRTALDNAPPWDDDVPMMDADFDDVPNPGRQHQDMSMPPASFEAAAAPHAARAGAIAPGRDHSAHRAQQQSSARAAAAEPMAAQAGQAQDGNIADPGAAVAAAMPRQGNPPQIDIQTPFVPIAIEALGWDGNWPQLAASLALRGVAQQLALQSELVESEQEAGATRLQLRVPVETYRSAANIEKLAAAVSEHFGKPVRIGTEIGPVRHTASAVAQAERASRQLAAEETMHNDPFVLTLIREFGASITPGSIRPL